MPREVRFFDRFTRGVPPSEIGNRRGSCPRWLALVPGTGRSNGIVNSGERILSGLRFPVSGFAVRQAYGGRDGGQESRSYNFKRTHHPKSSTL